MIVNLGIQLGETINKRSVDLSKTCLSGLFKELNGTFNLGFKLHFSLYTF